MLTNYSRHGDAIRDLGLAVAVTERISSPAGESRFVSMIVTPAGRLVASYWCERSGEWSGAGWVGLGAGCSSWPAFLDELRTSVEAAA